eukprot:TRINITY_DN5752_c0_g1_i3.p1 TRINITY_DN5752_c0_g1~~TRINITY_DN5752_c0_g1_i3.p1  ORF type:complete len:619 (-),score=118.91 TRINITY_DN5752_c0_g1_i3:45-1655(-)
MYCEYSKEFINQLKRAGSKADDQKRADCALKATHSNQHYKELNPDPKQQLQNIYIDLTQKDPPDSEEMLAEDDAAPSDAQKTSVMLDPALFIHQVLAKQIHGEELITGLQGTICELHPEVGSHVLLAQPGERERSESACLSLLALTMNDYELYTRPQAPPVKLGSEQWNELQKICRWIQPSVEHTHACVVLLAIRSLGKSKTAVQQLPSDHQRPEPAVIYMMSEVQNVVPSVTKLSEHGFRLIEQALTLHEQFNLAQMLQGENSPGNVQVLQNLVKIHGDEAFRFYVFFLLGFMSGLAGGQGSRFMSSRNAQGVIAGFKRLQTLTHLEPQLIYWNFMADRAQHFGIPAETPEDLALVRLACLIRVQGAQDVAQLRTAWFSLPSKARDTLVNHFLADGIDQRTFVLEFLPLCMSHARANATVKLTAMLEVVVELLDNLGPSVDAMNDLKDVKNLHVDLSDMAEFISVVQNRFVFQTSIMRSKVRVEGKRLYLEMTGGNWSRTNDADSDMTTLAHTMKEVLQKMEIMEGMIARSSHDD